MNRQISVNRFTTTPMSFTAVASHVSGMTVKPSDTCSSRRRSQYREQTSPSTGFSGCRGAAMTQSRSDSGVYTGLTMRHVQCEMPHRCVRRKCQFRRSSASSLTDSLRSVVRLRRAESTHSKAVIQLSTESGDNAGKNM